MNDQTKAMLLWLLSSGLGLAMGGLYLGTVAKRNSRVTTANILISITIAGAIFIFMVIILALIFYPI